MEPTISGTDVRDWLVDLRADCSPCTIESYKTSAKQYLASSGGEVSRAALRQFMAELEEAGRAPATRVLRFTALRSFLGRRRQRR